MKLGFSTLALPLALAACPIGCGDRAPARDEANADRHARRVISLIPSATQTIIALGARERLVARTDYDYDPALAHLPSVGQGLTPSLEQLTLLEPDLVIAWPDNPSRSIATRMVEFGAQVFTPELQTLTDIKDTTRELGARLGLEAAAESLIARIDIGLSDVRQKVAGLEPRSVFYVVWYDPPTTSGSGTYINELIEIAGGRNIFADAPGLWPQVSMEEVVRRQPEIVIFSQTEDAPIDVEDINEAVGWRELEAIRRASVALVDANFYNRPGPHVYEVARDLARLIHPEADPESK